MAALVYASRDPDSEVRNNSTRALGEILRADPSVASVKFPLTPSSTWSGQAPGAIAIKDASRLWPLTQSRDPRVLAKMQIQIG